MFDTSCRHLTDGTHNAWAVETFSVSGEEAAWNNLQAMYGRGRPIVSGTYKRLLHHQTVIMSNTPVEVDDHTPFIREARERGGHVLINGLGMGMCLSAILPAKSITRVTVVEIDLDLIKFIGSLFADTVHVDNTTLPLPNDETAYRDPRVELVNADAIYGYKPPRNTRYTAVWHDIWPDICTDNLPEMTRLKRRYGRRSDWQGCWGEPQCRRAWKREQEQHAYLSMLAGSLRGLKS